MNIQALPYVLLLGFLFGSTTIASRFCIGQFEPTTYLSIRMLIASAGHLLIYLFGRPRFKFPTSPVIWKHATVMGILGTAIPFTFLVMSMKYQSAGMTSVLETTTMALTVLLAHFLLTDQKLTLRTSLGVMIAFSGALLLVIRGENGLGGSAANPVGYILVFIGLAGSASSNIYAHKYMRELDSFDVASVRMFTATLSIVPLSILLVGFDLSRVDAAGYWATLYASISGNFVGLLLSFYIIKKYGATASSMTSYVMPVVTTLGGVAILDEKFTAGMLAGMLLIIVGIAIINQKMPSGKSLRGTKGIDTGYI